MIHTISTFDGKPAVKTPTEILDADVLKANADVLDANILDANFMETNSPISNAQSGTIAPKYAPRHTRQHAQQHSSIDQAKRHLTVTTTITVMPIEGVPSASQSTAGAVQSVVISANTPKSSHLTNYIVNSDDLSTYIQPYPSIFFSAQSLSNGPRRVPSIRLPWLELGGALAALTIISGVVFIDGLKQAKLSATSQPMAKLTPPKLTSIPKVPPLDISQMSVAELKNLGRSSPMQTNVTNSPTQQITSNPIASNSGDFGSLNMVSGNMKTVGLTQIGTTPIATNSTLPKPTTAPLMPRRPIAMPETEVRGSQVLPAPRMPVRTQPIPEQSIPEQSIPEQSIPQAVSQQPPVSPSAFPPQEIPKTPIVPSLAPALPTTSFNPANPLTYNRPDLIQAPTPPQNPSLSTSNVGTVN
jgi:hypothetical protein